MDRLVYTALTGLQRAQEAQAVTAHNLANLSTPGFRRQLAALSPGWLDAGGPTPSARAQSSGDAPIDILTAGRIEATGRPLDIAMAPDTWLGVEDCAGQPALTRRGDLHVEADGRLLTGAGHAVRGEGGPVRLASDFAGLRIGRDGTLEVLPGGETAWVRVDRLMLQSPPPASLAHGADGLFRTPDDAADPLATVQVGALEQSNMDPAGALVELVQQSRLFEMQTKLLSAAREMDEGGASLMRVE